MMDERAKSRGEPQFSFGTKELESAARAARRKRSRPLAPIAEPASLGPGEKCYGFDPYNSGDRDARPSRWRRP